MKNELRCTCDCECKKISEYEGEQCEDCDNGIHYDKNRNVYVNYETMEIV